MTSWERIVALGMAGMILGACSKKSSTSLFDRKADNAFTQMVDSGVSTMDQAQTRVDQQNVQTAEQEKEMKEMANQ